MYKKTNKEIIQILKEAMSAMEAKNFNFFAIRAYQNAIAILENLTSSIYDLWENHQLDQIPGLGKSLISHIDELFTSGKCAAIEEVKQGLPEGMFALIGLRGIGARKAFKLATAFSLNNRDIALAQLKKHATNHEIQKVEGFGAKSELDILQALTQSQLTKNEKPRILYPQAELIVERITQYLKSNPKVLQVETAGSFRRKMPTIGDLDFIVETRHPKDVIEYFASNPEVAEILTKGENKCMVVLKNEVQADIRVSTSEAFGAMLQYNTGSKQHNIILRTYALKRHLSLSEYGIKSENGQIEEFATEEAFYEKLGLPVIPPEIRTGGQELDLAIKNHIPKLIKLSDIKGDLHTHSTNSSDGVPTIEELVERATTLGYEYIGISDHAPSIQSRGYDEVKKVILKTKEHINKINSQQNKVKVLFGYEVNILSDSTISLPNEFLKLLDYTIAGLHTALNQERSKLTQRYISACKNPYVTFIAHPLGRLINERESLDVDWNRVLSEVSYYGKALEINSQPNRIDLDETLISLAVSKGINFVINTDAHEVCQLEYMKYGVFCARRAYLEPKHVLNSFDYKDLSSKLAIR